MKKYISIFSLLVALASPQFVLAAFVSVGSIGAITVVSDGTTASFLLTAQLDAGNLGVCFVHKDNTATSDGNTSEAVSVTDTPGNTWTKRREFTNSNAAAGAGATVAIFTTRATFNVTTSQNIVATIDSASRRVKGVSCWEFTVGAAVSVAGNATDSAVDAGDAASMVISGLTSKEYLFVRATAVEHNASNNWTPTTNYTSMTQSTNDDGSASLGMGGRGEFRILTGTGDTSDPTLFVNGDNASVFIAIREDVAAASGSSGLSLLGVGN